MNTYRSYSNSLILFAIISFGSASLQAQAASSLPDSTKYGWMHSAAGLLNLNQTYYDKWAKGGTDAFAYEWKLNAAIALIQQDYTWESKAIGTYGRTKLGSQASRKSSDQFDFETVYTRLLKIHVNPFASAFSQSQFFPGFSYDEKVGTHSQTSDYFNPAYFIETIGVGVEPIKDLKERLGATMKQSVGSFAFQKDGNRTGEDFKQEYGVSSTTEYQFSPMENIQAATRLDLFANFQGVENIDGRWANRITAKVNKWVNVNGEYELLYDADMSLDTQSRENIAIGISFLSL